MTKIKYGGLLLTDKEIRDVWQYVSHNSARSRRDIMDASGMNSLARVNTVMHFLHDSGLITLSDGKSRAYTVNTPLA